MKRSFLLPALLLVLSMAHGQSHVRDSLLNVIATSHDTAKVMAYGRLSYLSKLFDTSLHLAETGRDLALKIRFKKGEALCLMYIGRAHDNISNYPRALDYYLQSYAISERIGHSKGMISVCRYLSNAYLAMSDHERALNYQRKEYTLREQTGEDVRIMYFGMGRVFEGLGKLDSALMYYQRSYEYQSTLPNKNTLAYVLCHLGNVHARMNNMPLAIAYTQLGVSTAKAVLDSTGLASVYYHMAEIYFKAGNTDSSRWYAQKSYDMTSGLGDRELLIETGLLLSKLHEGNDKLAFKYYKTAMTVKDSIFGLEKTRQIQNLNYSEFARQQEISLLKLKEESERKHTIQYMLIGVGLLTFIIIFMLLSRSIIVNEKLIVVFGIIGLLMVFEFINLLLHPWLTNITDHNPLLMLLAMVIIAALLVPLHHAIEKWIKHRLVEKNKAIRLAAAKKVIAKLEPKGEDAVP